MGVTFGPESSVIAKPPGSPCDSLDINFIYQSYLRILILNQINLGLSHGSLKY